MFDREQPREVTLPSHLDFKMPPPISSFYPSMRFSEWAKIFEKFKVNNPPTRSTKQTTVHGASGEKENGVNYILDCLPVYLQHSRTAVACDTY